MANESTFHSSVKNPVLQNGDSGNAVVELQRFLKEQGAILQVDGQFGPSTLAAVISFQQKKGLPVSGIVDAQTWSAVRND